LCPVILKMAGVQEFQKFMGSDAQLKANGNCVNQVNLFALDPERPVSFNQRPNRVALVVDGESCLDRLYGGYFPDWSCGGQWQNMIAFLSTLMTNCHHANVHMAIFYNGAIEPTRFADWVKTQMKHKQNVNQVMKHLTKRMTPPPKAFWLPPCSLRTMLRLALRSLSVPVYNSLEDHHHEIMSFCWENGYHGVLSDEGEFALYNPPKYFSAHDLKLSYQHELMTSEYVIDEIAKSLDLNPNRFELVAALLGCHILTVSDLSEFHQKLVPELKQVGGGEDGKDYKVGFDRVIRAVVNYVRALPSIEDHDTIANDVFGTQKDPRVKKMKDSVKYFHKGTKEGHVKQKMPKKAGTIKPNQDDEKSSPTKSSEGQSDNGDQKSKKEQKEADLVERIALDLDQLDLDETVEKVKQELFDDNGDLEPVGLVQALASGAEVAPSEGGKYPHKSESIKPIKIPKVHFEVRKTAIDRHRLGQMSPFIYQLLTKGEIKLPVVLESDVLPQIHRFYQPLRQRIYAILFNLYHARFDRRQLEEKAKGLRRKADELRRNAKKETEESDKAEEMRTEANKLMKEASEIVEGPDLATFVVREWLPYDDYETPDAIEATELSWPTPTIQRLWFGTVQEDKQKRIQAFLSCMHCDELPHGNLPPHMLIMACVLRYMLVKGHGESPVLRKPELDAFLATAMSPELRNVTYLAEMRLEMVTIRGVHLAAIFMQGLEMALLANDACGSPIPVQMCLPWQFFDGKLFHSKLIKATQARNLIELCDGRVQMAYQIERTREIIMGGSHIIPSQRPMSMVNPGLWRPQINKPKFQPKKKNKNKGTKNDIQNGNSDETSSKDDENQDEEDSNEASDADVVIESEEQIH